MLSGQRQSVEIGHIWSNHIAGFQDLFCQFLESVRAFFRERVLINLFQLAYN